jgi:hypothetical protein
LDLIDDFAGYGHGRSLSALAQPVHQIRSPRKSHVGPRAPALPLEVVQLLSLAFSVRA